MKEKMKYYNWLYKKRWFTLVELIIVITILVILFIIAFLSFQSYTRNARDSGRVAELSIIQKWIDVYTLKVGQLPDPEWSIAQWSLNTVLLNKVWIIWGNIVRSINLSKVPQDTLWLNNYAYWVSSDNKYYQVWVTLEKWLNTALISQAYAQDVNQYRWKVLWNYNYPFKLCNTIYSLPSLLFTWSWGDLKLTTNYFVIDHGLNIPYSPKGSLQNTKLIPDVLMELLWTWWLDLTWIVIPETMTNGDFKALSNNDSLILRLQNWIWIYDKNELWRIIYGYKYDTDTSNKLTIVPPWVTCELPTVSSWSISGSNSCNSILPNNATSVTGTPVTQNQSWQWNNPNQPCYFTCNPWYGYNWTSCITATACSNWLEYITLSNGQSWSCKNLWATTVWDWVTPTVDCSWSSTNCNSHFTWVWDYYQWWRNDTSFTNVSSPYYHYDWQSRNDAAWGWSLNDTIYDDGVWTTDVWRQWPCPVWWHVPSRKDWQDMCIELIGWICNASWPSNNIITTLKLPYAGFIQLDNATYQFQDEAYYWSSSPEISNFGGYWYWYWYWYTQTNGYDPWIDGTAYYFTYNSLDMDSDVLKNYRWYGHNVRCIKN